MDLKQRHKIIQKGLNQSKTTVGIIGFTLEIWIPLGSYEYFLNLFLLYFWVTRNSTYDNLR